MSKPRVSTKSAKAAVLRPEYRSRVVRDRTKYRRKDKHSQRLV
jgi:hypothetical protein